jgi:hypothetical protein
LLISQEPSDGEVRNHDNEDNPNIDAHQSSPLPLIHARRGEMKPADDERPADLLLWWKDGMLMSCDAAESRSHTEVSIGRTNSKRALGFIVTRGNKTMDFVLNKDQVARLACYLTKQDARLLKPRGRKPGRRRRRARAANG